MRVTVTVLLYFKTSFSSLRVNEHATRIHQAIGSWHFGDVFLNRKINTGALGTVCGHPAAAAVSMLTLLCCTVHALTSSLYPSYIWIVSNSGIPLVDEIALI